MTITKTCGWAKRGAAVVAGPPLAALAVVLGTLEAEGVELFAPPHAASTMAATLSPARTEAYGLRLLRRLEIDAPITKRAYGSELRGG